MFSCVFRRNNEVTEQTETTPVEPQVQGINGSTTETSLSDSKKRPHVSVDNMENSSKCPRFELDTEDSPKNGNCLQDLLPISINIQ